MALHGCSSHPFPQTKPCTTAPLKNPGFMSCTSAQSKPGPATSWKGPPPPKAPCHPRAGAGSLTIGRRRHQSVSRKPVAWPLFVLQPLWRGYKGHDTGAAEGGQPGGAPWRMPRIPATAEGSGVRNEQSEQSGGGDATGAGLREMYSAQVP